MVWLGSIPRNPWRVWSDHMLWAWISTIQLRPLRDLERLYPLFGDFRDVSTSSSSRYSLVIIYWHSRHSRIAIPSAFPLIARDTVTVSLKLAIASCSGIQKVKIRIRPGQKEEMEATREGSPGHAHHKEQREESKPAYFGKRQRVERKTDARHSTVFGAFGSIYTCARSLMRWIPIGTALFAPRLIVLHVTNHNWLSLILSKLCFANDITDRVFRLEVILAMYKSIVTMSLATVLGSLVTVVLVNQLPRHLALIWSSLVLAIFLILPIWAHDLTLFFLQVVSRTQSLSCRRFSDSKHADSISQVLIAATNPLMLSPLQTKSHEWVSFSAKYPRLRFFLCLFLWLLLKIS